MNEPGRAPPPVVDRGAYRRLLGEKHVARLQAEVARVEQRESLPAQATDELEATRAALIRELGDPLESLDREGAYETRRLQRDQLNAEALVTEGLQELRRLGVVPPRGYTNRGDATDVVERADAMLGELRGCGILPEPGSPAMRSTPNDRLRALGQSLLGDRDRVLELRTVEQHLRKGGTHLDEWVERQWVESDPADRPPPFQQLSRLQAVENELAIRAQQRELAGQPVVDEHTMQPGRDAPGFER